ncbi:DEKNAAC105436 [Brettanomyces naardenensis]|uniref:DEKNAAC105436 n=1 Tax=Brettanomyces naardenensis TaxID=13370 RepID=A0A448YTF7_BRENA|nr:DEKNAAC105436 [Brettanomyces naardenensis]
MILGQEKSNQCGWVVDVGNDCPSEILDELKGWNTGAIFRYHRDRQCNHGWNKYGANEHRQFKFTAPQIDITVKDLLQYRELLHSKSYHFILSPKQCLEVLDKLEEVRGAEDSPLIVWEPDPNDCTSDMLEEILPVLERIDILSPNSAECASFLGLAEPTDHSGCEQIARRFLPRMLKSPNSAVVLRCGAMGSLLMSHETVEWFPPYHTDDDKVVDPTGCGNTFVGAFGTGVVMSGGDLRHGCICGTLASGVAIEQHGVGHLREVEGVEEWNGVSIKERRRRYLRKQEAE